MHRRKQPSNLQQAGARSDRLGCRAVGIMAKSRRLTKLWGTLREGRPQSLPVHLKRFTANFRSIIISRKTILPDLNMPLDLRTELHEADPRFTSDARFVCTTPNADDDVKTDDDHELEAGCRIDVKEPVEAEAPAAVEGGQGIKIPRWDAEPAKKLGEMYGLGSKPSERHPTEGHDVLCVEKPIRMRVRRECHLCTTSFGQGKECPKCQHPRCKQCPRLPSSSAQEKRKRPGEHDDSAQESARHGLDSLEDQTSAPPDISRKSSTKKAQEIISWVNQQPETSHLSGHDAEQAPEFPPSRSDSGDLSAPGDTFGVAKEGEPPSMEFGQSWSSSARRFHLPRPPHVRVASQDPKTRGMHSPSYASCRPWSGPWRANLEQCFENRSRISSPRCHAGEHLSPNTVAFTHSQFRQPRPFPTSSLYRGETRR